MVTWRFLIEFSCMRDARQTLDTSPTQ